MILTIAKICIKLSICSGFFQEIIAARAVGEGSQAYSEKRYQEAFNILKPIADFNINDAYVGNAQYIVGLLYLHGLGIDQNLSLAEKFLSEAVKRNNQEAKIQLKRIRSANDS